ncbi:MAG TPA: 23S rRNA pseudouridine(955/2504/2580) synthase RluC, partial [Thiolapillus brandeum]|nr:23S rRNA pseudouridine(955/2504/2580) synthase RluC [Thiolapillus brandeum]
MTSTHHQQVRYVTVDERGDGQRIDNFLLRELKGVPRALIYRVLRKGEVRVNKGRVKAGRKLVAGDVVRIPPVRLPSPSETGIPPDWKIKKIEESIIYEDKLLLIINKESGLAVHGGSGISFGVIELLRASRPQEKALELAHRLDRDTSGCLMLARKRSALRTLQQLQREGRVQKRYLALLAGRWCKDKQQVKVPLKKNTLKSGERVVRVDAAGKEAHTEFRVLKRFADATLVEAVLKTGRTHQIRVHAQYLGTPILGDEKYGDEQVNREYRKLGLKRLFLHAASLRFPWPDREQGYA